MIYDYDKKKKLVLYIVPILHTFSFYWLPELFDKYILQMWTKYLFFKYTNSKIH